MASAVQMSQPGQQRLSGSRTVVLATANTALRRSLCAILAARRWSVREARGGAEALAHLEDAQPEAVLIDGWLPDLEAGDFTAMLLALYPNLDLLRMDGQPVAGAKKGLRRSELLEALVVANEAEFSDRSSRGPSEHPELGRPEFGLTAASQLSRPRPFDPLPGLVGQGPQMQELTRLIRLVAPRSATVLIEGETGTGKEVVAHALHRLSARAQKPFVVLNCAAIPEALLEAELFGHTRGAFTGATGSRTGRIEAANGGTVFLDEIGEMPLALQAKLLRFLEAGEIQRVGDNDITRVDVRILAATHQHLERRADEGTFRLDLYHRLAVFPLEVPPLRDRRTDLPDLIAHLLRRLTKEAGAKPLSAAALAALEEHAWPGNVRELAHVLERALILASDSPQIEATHVRLRRTQRT